ncbi:MAG: hypothetical protein IT308_06960 [Anaerolineaceae bacterium]|nr:hypothetical protein [Anaerolineaceae bacterium]
MLGLLLFFQRRLHREVQVILLILTRRPALVIGIFSFLFFPGVALHETSHFLMARLLGVRTGRFSLLPKMLPDGRLRMGYIETSTTDFLREALIGAAPLLTGVVCVAYMGINHLGLSPMTDALRWNAWENLVEALLQLPQQPDFWLWFYLIFAISSMMFPSASDQRGWLPLAFIFGAVTIIALLAGAGNWMLENLAPRLNSFFLSLAAVFAISLLTHVTLIVPTSIFRLLLSRITGLRVA